MNHLQKKAWTELVLMFVVVGVAAAGLTVLVHLNAKGVVHVVIFTAAGLGSGLFSCLRSIRFTAGLDERERLIAQKAFVYAAYAFVLVIAGLSFILFFLTGAAGQVPVYVLPVLLLTGLMAAQIVESSVVLIQFEKEHVNG